MVTDFGRWTRDIDTARRQAQNFATSLGNTMTAAGDSMSRVGASLTKYITLPIVAAGTAVFKFGKDFEAEMTKVEALTGTAKEQTKAWGNAILKMSPEVGKMPKELAEGMYYIASAGIKGKDAMDALTSSAKASTAGLGETKDIANVVTSAMNAYKTSGMTAAKATDILIEAVKQGKTDASAFAVSLGQVLPISSVMGVSFDQVAGIIAILSRNGLDAAEAVTQLKGMLSGLIKPSKQAEDSLNMMGTSSAKLRKQIKEEGLLSVLTNLNELTKKYGDDALAKVFPNIRAFSGVLAITNLNAQDNAGIMDACANSAGNLDKAFKITSETLDFKWNQALAKVQTTLISFYDVVKSAMIPVLNIAIKVLDWITDKFKGMSPTVQKVILVIAGIAATIGPALMIVGGIITLIGSTLTSLGVIAATVSAVIASGFLPIIAAVGIAVGIVAVVIGGLIATFIYLWKTNAEFRDRVSKIWNQIKDTAISVFTNIKNTIMFAFNQIKDFWKKHSDVINIILSGSWAGILDTIKVTLDIIKGTVKIFCDLVQGDWSGAWEGVKKLTGVLITDIGNIITEGQERCRKFSIAVFNDIKTSILNAWNSVKNFTSTLVTDIKNIIIKEFNESMKAVQSFINNLPAYISGAWETIKKETPIKLVEWKNAIINKFTEIGTTIVEWCKSIPKFFSNLWNTISKNFNMRESTNGLISTLGNITNKVIEWCKNLPKFFSNLWDNVNKIWNTKLKPINDSMAKVLIDIGKMIGDWVAGIVDKFSNVWDNVKKAIVKKFTEISHAIVKELESWGKAISKWFRELPNTLLKLLEGWKKALKKYSESQAKEWQKDLAKWWETIKKWFSSIPGKIGKEMELWWKGIKKWFTETKKSIAKQLETWWEAFKTWFVEMPGKIAKEMELWWKGIKKWFVETKKSITKQLETWWETLKSFFTETPGKIGKELENWWKSMKKWFIETKKSIGKQLESWWEGIKEWFSGLGNKKDIEDSGKKMIKKLKKGVTDAGEKKDFMEKLGKLIVDCAGYAIVAAGFALLATGKEIVKRIAKGIESLNLKKTGEKLIQSIIDGITGMVSKVGKAMEKVAEKIKGYLPHSPAKVGPLKDLNKVNFYSSLEESLNKARSKISMPAFNLGQEIIKNIGQNPKLGIEGIGGTNKSVSFGTMNFYGIKDMNSFMREMQAFIQKHTGRVL
jgi:TP901 family phage tail tape measure protein